MAFSERAKTIALAIVKIFETSKPFGNYEAVAVLDDGAGISYGVSQFTHKSGSLYAVLSRFVDLGGELPATVRHAMNDFRNKARILARSNDKAVKTALKALGKEPLMQQAQREIAFENYLKKALDACEGSDFTLPLSLAVIYDSINHGSYEKIRDKVQLNLPASIKPVQYEKEWISQYVQKRDAWLESIPRLAKTDYRTDFFLAQIARGNWELNLPMNVHGFKLTEEILFPQGVKDSAPIVPQITPIKNSASAETVSESSDTQEAPIDFTEGERPTTNIENIENANIENKPLPKTEPVKVTVERVSIWTKVGAGLAALTGLGINFGNVVMTRLNEMTLVQLGYVLGGVAIIGIALLVYDKAARRAHEKTLAKMATASDPSQNTVELREQTTLKR